MIQTIKPNPGKQIKINLEGTSYARYPIKTEVFKNGDDYAKKIAKYVATFTVEHSERYAKNLTHLSFLRRQESRDPSLRWDDTERKWYIVVSEKIVAISQ